MWLTADNVLYSYYTVVLSSFYFIFRLQVDHTRKLWPMINTKPNFLRRTAVKLDGTGVPLLG